MVYVQDLRDERSSTPPLPELSIDSRCSVTGGTLCPLPPRWCLSDWALHRSGASNQSLLRAYVSCCVRKMTVSRSYPPPPRLPIILPTRLQGTLSLGGGGVWCGCVIYRLGILQSYNLHLDHAWVSVNVHLLLKDEDEDGRMCQIYGKDDSGSV